MDEIHFLGKEMNFPKKCHTKIRYRQADQECEIFQEDGKYKIVFSQKQRAIASGQIAALYDGDELWGSGIIV
jgi:tRNA-specific 2-thiouridylase